MKFKYSEVQKMIKHAVKEERERASRFMDDENRRRYMYENMEQMEKRMSQLERRVRELEEALRPVENCNKENKDEVAMTTCNVPFPNPGCCTW